MNRASTKDTGARSSREPDMGTFNRDFIEAIWRAHPSYRARLAVETGTCLGYSTRILAEMFVHVWSIEISAELHARARVEMHDLAEHHVRFILGDSAEELPALLPALHEAACFYLDAHWSGDERVDFAGQAWPGYGVATGHRQLGSGGALPSSQEQVPLAEEIAAIVRNFPHAATVYIDDFRMFDGGGKKDVGFPGADWSHLSNDLIAAICGARLAHVEIDEVRDQLVLLLRPT